MNNNIINQDDTSSVEEEEVLEAKDEDVAEEVAVKEEKEEEFEEEDADSEESFEELFNKSVEEKKIVEGQIIKGVIVTINREEVLVDVGYKSEGRIPASEFKKVDGRIDQNIGDEIDIIIEKKENDSGQIILSKEKADKIKLWNNIASAFEKAGVVEGKITARVKGGFTVDIGVKAFLPASQLDNKPVKDFSKFIGQSYPFKILEFNKTKGNIVLSRKALLEKEALKLKEHVLEHIHEGKKIKGIVKNITDYGVFVDLGHIDGLLHITDISWGRVSHPLDVFSVGDEIDVIVLKFDREQQRISLGHKQLSDDPWKMAAEKYPVNSKVTGKVVTLVDYGAFIELEAGIEGLIHISEMSWTKKIKHPSKLLNVGDEINVIVLALDTKNKRLSLGLKQVGLNPWDKIIEKYPVGTIVERSIKNITDFGLFIEFEDDIDGLIHISDISWGKKIKSLKDIYKKGDMVQAKVLEINPKEDKCSLTIKGLTENPWRSVEKKYRKGSIVNGTVKNITEFGAFVELEDNIEGLIHISEIKDPKDATATENIKPGEGIKALVIFCSSRDKKISLSIKDLEKKMERDEIKKYLANQEKVTSKLMDFVTHDSRKDASAEKKEEPPEKSAPEPKAPAEAESAPDEAVEPEEAPAEAESAPDEAVEPEEAPAEAKSAPDEAVTDTKDKKSEGKKASKAKNKK